MWRKMKKRGYEWKGVKNLGFKSSRGMGTCLQTLGKFNQNASHQTFKKSLTKKVTRA